MKRVRTYFLCMTVITPQTLPDQAPWAPSQVPLGTRQVKLADGLYTPYFQLRASATVPPAPHHIFFLYPALAFYFFFSIKTSMIQKKKKKADTHPSILPLSERVRLVERTNDRSTPIVRRPS